jgi:PKD domain
MKRGLILAAAVLLVGIALIVGLSRYGRQPAQAPATGATPHPAGFSARSEDTLVHAQPITPRSALAATPEPTPAAATTGQQSALRVVIIAVPPAGLPPLQVHFSAIIVPLTISPHASADSIVHADRDLQFDWDLGNGSRASGSEVNSTYEQAGTYQVTLVLTDKVGQTTQSTTEIRVIGVPTADAQGADLPQAEE